jgi:hypothetical protein
MQQRMKEDKNIVITEVKELIRRIISGLLDFPGVVNEINRTCDTLLFKKLTKEQQLRTLFTCLNMLGAEENNPSAYLKEKADLVKTWLEETIEINKQYKAPISYDLTSLEIHKKLKNNETDFSKELFDNKKSITERCLYFKMLLETEAIELKPEHSQKVHHKIFGNNDPICMLRDSINNRSTDLLHMYGIFLIQLLMKNVSWYYSELSYVNKTPSLLRKLILDLICQNHFPSFQSKIEEVCRVCGLSLKEEILEAGDYFTYSNIFKLLDSAFSESTKKIIMSYLDNEAPKSKQLEEQRIREEKLNNELLNITVPKEELFVLLNILLLNHLPKVLTQLSLEYFDYDLHRQLLQKMETGLHAELNNSTFRNIIFFKPDTSMIPLLIEDEDNDKEDDNNCRFM